jgi:hypothetical protein
MQGGGQESRTTMKQEGEQEALEQMPFEQSPEEGQNNPWEFTGKGHSRQKEQPGQRLGGRTGESHLL